MKSLFLFGKQAVDRKIYLDRMDGGDFWEEPEREEISPKLRIASDLINQIGLKLKFLLDQEISELDGFTFSIEEYSENLNCISVFLPDEEDAFYYFDILDSSTLDRVLGSNTLPRVEIAVLLEGEHNLNESRLVSHSDKELEYGITYLRPFFEDDECGVPLLRDSFIAVLRHLNLLIESELGKVA